MNYINEMFGLQDKTIILTGGGGAIAGALAEAYLNAGAKVALWDIKLEFAEAAEDRLSSATGISGKILPVEVDTMSEESTVQALEKTVAHFGSVDVLVNAAGGNRGKSPFVETDVALFEDIVKLNLVAGLVVPTKVIAAWWTANKKPGSIINLASMASYIPLSGVWAYGAAKAGVMNLTMATAKEFAADGIRVNALAPGFFIGKQNRALLIDEKTGELTPRGKDVINHTPFERFGDVSELAGAALFLASEKAAGFITGVTLPVDGGYLIHNI